VSVNILSIGDGNILSFAKAIMNLFIILPNALWAVDCVYFPTRLPPIFLWVYVCGFSCDFQFVFGVRVFLAFCVSIWQIKVQASRNSISRLILPVPLWHFRTRHLALCANFKCGKSPFFSRLSVWFKLRKAHVLLFVSIACWRAMDSEI